MTRQSETRSKFIAAAEKLYGTKGLDQVKTKDLLREVGQKNESALQYHFGNREGLIDATVCARLQDIDKRRLELFAQAEADGMLKDLPTLISVMVSPFIEQLKDPEQGRSVIRFLSQILGRPGFAPADTIEKFGLEGMKKVHRLVMNLPHEISNDVTRQRDNQTFNFAIHTLKMWSEGSSALDYDLMAEDLLTCLHAIATAPAPKTIRGQNY
jgi:AcrR family transcriptional regulator